ncbi:MAG: FAD-dependent oxidoreductase, partial [Acidobacteriota bacterium]|nr:FAD-dependent oxidoreductase [Acidobacteriota bacterium]
MRRFGSEEEHARVVIAGGGFAAVEAMLTLRALAPERIEVVLVSASATLAYKPAATAEAFSGAPPLTYDLEALACGAGAAFRHDRVEAVAGRAHSIRLASFASLEYDQLVLATGARPVIGIPGALTFRDQREVHHIRHVIDRRAEGEIGPVVFAVPHGRAWPLPV